MTDSAPRIFPCNLPIQSTVGGNTKKIYMQVKIGKYNMPSNPKNILAADGLKKFRQWKNLNKKIHASRKSTTPPPAFHNSIPY